MAFDADFYKSTVQRIDAEIEADLEIRIQACVEDCKKQAEEKRRNAIEAFNEAWPKMGGSKEDLVAFVAESKTPSSSGTVEVDSSREVASRNGSLNQPANKDIVEQELRDVLSGPEIGIITQTGIRKRVLDKYPNRNEDSVRAVVNLYLSELVQQGKLEVVEKGKAGRPSKYRKKVMDTKTERVNPLGP